MKRPRPEGELFPDAERIQKTLERCTRDALIQRLGPPSPDGGPLLLPQFDLAERQKARGIGFAVDLVRAILEGRKTQTRRLVRPQPAMPPGAEDCPTARTGELLYVREPWLRVPEADGRERVLYAADASHDSGRRFKPAMYMPRSAARLWLRVADVRVERLQAISAGDLVAEGLMPGQSLAAVWDAFYNGPGQRYADDPWVWVIGFTVESS